MENEDGVTEEDLKLALKEVHGKKTILKMQHKLKKNLRAKSKNKNIKDLEEHLDKMGIDVNKDTLRSRIKKRRSIGDLEGKQDKLATKIANESDDEAEEVEEGKRGRKRLRSMSDDEDYMDIDTGREKSV